jgi:hypothetical protein
MNKPVLVVTHERSGTHLLINIINYENNGGFYSIGYLDRNQPFNLENYYYQVKKDILIGQYREGVVFKSHHQVDFYDDTEILDFLFENYYVIYLKRDIKDVLVSYYKFLNDSGNRDPISNFPKFKDWIFMDPRYVAKKYLGYKDFPDPHIIWEPNNYIDRWLLHYNGWMKHNDKIFTTSYEKILTDFKTEKQKIENYINKKIRDYIPDVNDKTLPNIVPNKGIIGSHKEYMDDELIKKIESWPGCQKQF